MSRTVARWLPPTLSRGLLAVLVGLALGYALSLGAAPASSKKPVGLLQAAPPPGTVPVGTVVAFAGYRAPPGWLLCDGALLSIVEYPELFQTLVFAHGRSDDGTQFKLPDYRGMFLRGVDAGAGRDPDATSRRAAGRGGSEGDAVGSVQGDALEAHTHPVAAVELKGKKRSRSEPALALGEASAEAGSDAPSTGPIGAGETRPRNAYVHWIIRAR